MTLSESYDDLFERFEKLANMVESIVFELSDPEYDNETVQRVAEILENNGYNLGEAK